MSDWQVLQGNCLKLRSSLPHVDAVVTDPPYGIDHKTDYTRFSGGVPPARRDYGAVEGDVEPFEPAPWLGYQKVVLFGANCYSDRLPLGSWLIWCKRRDSKLGAFMSDCEVAWMKGGHGVYLFNHVWDGFDKASERGVPRIHPTQKPVAVMRWVIERLRLPKGATILAPYMGAGATGVAALQLGYRFIGIDLNAEYCEAAQRRLKGPLQAEMSLQEAV